MKKSYDRRPLLTTVADKVKAREYAIHKLSKNIIIKDKSNINRTNIINKWLSIDYYYFEKEWAYKNIKRLVFV